MPRGQNFSKEKWSELGREGGKVSAMVRRDRIFDKYLRIVQDKGIIEALRVCRADAWRSGYEARKVASRAKGRKPNVLRSTGSDGKHAREEIT